MSTCHTCNKIIAIEARFGWKLSIKEHFQNGWQIKLPVTFQSGNRSSISQTGQYCVCCSKFESILAILVLDFVVYV